MASKRLTPCVEGALGGAEGCGSCRGWIAAGLLSMGSRVEVSEELRPSAHVALALEATESAALMASMVSILVIEKDARERDCHRF